MAVNPPLVTLLGATGFVGSAVLRELARRPLRIRAVSRRPAPVPPDARAEIEVHTADLTAPGAVAEAVAGADVVIHTVLYSAGATTWRVEKGDTAAERVNVGLLRDLVETLRERRAAEGGTPVRVLWAGAASQAGPQDKEVLDGTETDRPRGEYDRQKLAAERLLLAADAEGVLRGAAIRLPTVFGYAPESTARDKGVVTLMTRRALAGEPITMWHDGTVRRDLLYIEDVARAFAAAVDHADALAGRRWLLGTGRGEPLGAVFTTIAALVAEHTGKSAVPVVSVPPPAHAEPGDFHSFAVDSSAFRTATGWRPQTPLDEALRRTVAFCAEGREESLL
ncbi:oxidoreductase [Streptomyces sp. F-3]|uniref:NAD-dependent epimerase/dehydratase domain-containing protein n=1 Tax=Streptomyces thermogriseus TaxID=75292 RepID=A0ABN1T5D9_9ACTN|nr:MULTISPECIES: NAD-dependent epimerase/dehydratase [Streptomyces]MDN5383429.1 NAD-dependent epimerase/dehydratase [Streptomyces sp. LB8]GAT84623.1 oxidoreductase [Streptomyces sp. F-3]